MSVAARKRAAKAVCKEVCAILNLCKKRNTPHEAWHSVEQLVAYKEDSALYKGFKLDDGTSVDCFAKFVKYCFSKNDHLGRCRTLTQ
jgi:hypothetical protein